MLARCLIGSFPSPLGTIHYATDDAGNLCAMAFHGREVLTRDVVYYHGEPKDWIETPNPAISDTMARYFSGEVEALGTLGLRPCGSAFEQSVWAALRSIPAGTTMSYGDIARQVGSPGASRAVGLANGRNPVAIVVPCHRVIGANGKLVGYGAGIERKRWLLAHEAEGAGLLRRLG